MIISAAWALLDAMPASCGMTCFCVEAGREVYGQITKKRIFSRITLLDIARQNDLGYNQITAANPGIDPWVPHDGALVTIPAAFILPENPPAQGIVINLAEMRLYLFTHTDHCTDAVYTCPVGTARTGFSTKPGIYTIYQKKRDPTWVPPKSVREEEPGLPQKVPPGPDNPLGKYVLRFSRDSYGIHGTNRPWGIGRRVSHGCIRLYPEDVEELFGLVDVGTLVMVRYQPVKAGFAHGRCWLQVCDDFEHRIMDVKAVAFEKLQRCAELAERKGNMELDFDLNAIRRVVEERRCMPVAVGSAEFP